MFYKQVADLYATAIEKAAGAVIAYAKLEPYARDTRDCPEFETALLEFDGQFGELENAVEALRNALPQQVLSGELSRHMAWCRRHIRRRRPWRCGNDPYSILERDLPFVAENFDAWYLEVSGIAPEFAERMDKFDRRDLLNSAVREAWTVFKSRTVQSFALDDNLDGIRLADHLFRDGGPLDPLIPEKERRGYLHLLRGLYALSRNPVMHNDPEPNPGEADAVVVLIGICLARILQAQADSGE